MVIYILCVENFQNKMLTHSCLPISGRLFFNVRKLHGPRISECNICFTLRSWVHEVFSRFVTVSPGSGDNYESKCGSGIFPHKKYMSQSVVLRIFHAPWHIFCVWKNVRTTFWCIVVSQSRGDRSKTWENFMDSGSQSETNVIFSHDCKARDGLVFDHSHAEQV